MRTLRPIPALLLALFACGEPEALEVTGGDPKKDEVGSRPDRVPEPGDCDLEPESATCEACRQAAFDACAGARGECGLLSQGIDECATEAGCASTAAGWDDACVRQHCATPIAGLNRCLLWCRKTLACGGAGAGVCTADEQSLSCSICLISGEEVCFNEICGGPYADWRTCILDNECNVQFYPVVDAVCETQFCDAEHQARNACVSACEPVMQCPPPAGFPD